MSYFDKWGYDDIRTKELDDLCEIKHQGIQSFQDIALVKQQLELMKFQSLQLREQVQVKRENLQQIKELTKNLEVLLDEESQDIEKKIEVERKTNNELNQYNIKKQQIPHLEDLQQYIIPLNERTQLYQQIQNKRKELFGDNYTLMPPQTFKDALKENYDLKQQLHELKMKIKQ
ncbi:unnamed protein product [Paramecium primaurelia]|uniref:Uncharacterized protein n=1 Tax=Paramecium primaurelia TaxID=5886 RepID=A0A8S1P359_PARPR|nr:unnamed protein product [Paramecium primaurelia]